MDTQRWKEIEYLYILIEEGNDHIKHLEKCENIFNLLGPNQIISPEKSHKLISRDKKFYEAEIAKLSLQIAELLASKDMMEIIPPPTNNPNYEAEWKYEKLTEQQRLDREEYFQLKCTQERLSRALIYPCTFTTGEEGAEAVINSYLQVYLLEKMKENEQDLQAFEATHSKTVYLLEIPE
jgi:hypothetical protein